MTTERPHDTSDGFSRRRLLQATSVSLATLGLAGCSGLTNQEFTAEPVSIPEESRSALGYAEQRAEGVTVERSQEVAGVELSATIESYFATYAPTLEAVGDEGAASGQQATSEFEARKEALFSSLRAAGSEDVLSLPSMAAVSTPKGEFAGQQLNPLANKDLGELLQSDRASDLLANGGGSGEGGSGGNATGSMPESMDWQREPESIETTDVSLVGTDTQLEAFGGLVEGASSPLFLLGTLARAVDESVVITAGTLALPVQQAERELVGESGFLASGELDTVLEGAVASNEAVEMG